MPWRMCCNLLTIMSLGKKERIMIIAKFIKDLV